MSKQITRNKPTNMDAIRRFYLDDRGRVELTEHQEHVRQRWLTAHAMLLEARAKKEITAILMARYEITDVQAYRDIRSATQLFGQVNRSEKEGLRHIAQEMAMETFRLARDEKDLAGMNKALANVIKLGGLDREDPDLPDFDKLKQGLYPIILDDPVREMLLQLINKEGSIDLTKFMQNAAEQAEPADYEDITDQSDQAGD